MAACELVLFDCDGTIMDSELLAAECEIEALSPYGIKMTPKEFSARFAGTSSFVVKEAMEEELGRNLPDDHIQTVKAKMREKLWREVKPMPGIHELLDRLDQARCVCSNADMEKLKIELTRGELWDRFRPYVFSAYEIETKKRKPEPDLFIHAAAEFEIAPQNCVVIEDSIAGVQAGVAARMRVIGFTGGSHTHPGHADELTNAGAETVVSRLSDIPATIEAFAKWEGLPA
ncbi:MAG: HAD-IA family hydrolase [Rhizobiaceae bacterium]